MNEAMCVKTARESQVQDKMNQLEKHIQLLSDMIPDFESRLTVVLNEPCPTPQQEGIAIQSKPLVILATRLSEYSSQLKRTREEFANILDRLEL